MFGAALSTSGLEEHRLGWLLFLVVKEDIYGRDARIEVPCKSLGARGCDESCAGGFTV